MFKSPKFEGKKILDPDIREGRFSESWESPPKKNSRAKDSRKKIFKARNSEKNSRAKN